MAYKLVFSYAQQGLCSIWNVSQHVGWKKTRPNRNTDVELAQSPGTLDATLGFWIWLEQDAPGAVKDGVMSPAKGVRTARTWG